MYEYKALITNVVDGDTVDSKIDLGFKITTQQRLRLLRVDTYELNSRNELQRELAQKAKQFMIEQCLNKEFIIRTEKSDSFGRYLADILYENTTISDILIENGLGVPYIK